MTAPRRFEGMDTVSPVTLSNVLDDEARGLAEELVAAIDGEVRFDAGSRAAYSTDASNYRQVPIGVVVPRSIADVDGDRRGMPPTRCPDHQSRWWYEPGRSVHERRRGHRLLEVPQPRVLRRSRCAQSQWSSPDATSTTSVASHTSTV